MSKLNGDHDSSNIRPDQLTAYALNQLQHQELASVERRLAEPNQASARQTVAETKRLAECLKAAMTTADEARSSSELRASILAQLEKQPSPQPVEVAWRSSWPRRLTWLAVGSAAAVLAAIAMLPAIYGTLNARRTTANNEARQIAMALHDYHDTHSTARGAMDEGLVVLSAETPPADNLIIVEESLALTKPLQSDPAPYQVELPHSGAQRAPTNNLATNLGSISGSGNAGNGQGLNRMYAAGGTSRPLATANDYYYPGQGQAGSSGMMAGGGYQSFSGDRMGAIPVGSSLQPAEAEKVNEGMHQLHAHGWYERNREQYEQIVENSFLAPTDHPLSTFSIDVDTASYSNVRRFLTGGRLPPPAAVRIEELVNYFSYSYPQPKGREPFSVNMETTECPWNVGHLLLRVGLKGKEIHRAERPASNLVFLLDVSGSMSGENKLPLLKTALLMFVAELTENDRVSIVTYAGEAGLRLPPTSGDQKAKIMQAIESLSAGGSTNGSAGIELAYEQAGQYFIKEGANRVILATDGDLNVGVTSDEALVELIKSKAAAGTFLTVLGFGEGNLQDAKLEKLADNGNGLYAYIDSVREGRKVLVEQMSGSTVTIAKDVKIQIEFNPAQIASYRLLGYENRVLAAKDFNDDKKDAGEIGAGHTVTALYELVPVGTEQATAPQPDGVEPLKYQRTGVGGQRSEVRGQKEVAPTDAAASGELLTLKLRYKEPDGVESRMIEFPLKERGGKFNAASKDLQFAAAVASFGMILRGSEHKGSGSLVAISEIAGGAIGDDPSGYRAEFVDLVRRTQALGTK